MIKIEIDGKTLEVAEGSMIIEASDAAGIYIPRFCYHKKLSIAANCRMCLIEVDGVKKPMPACATPVAAGMKVFTQSKFARDAQKIVMEFLLINHPLDCPICDQGGECELQDLSMGFGKDVGRFTEGKRSVKDEDIGPLIFTEMTRCIHCTRCVRFGQEIAGMREMGATGRGEDMKIGTFVKHMVASEVSGNIIDLCPVGALTSKPYRFQARAWELQQHPTIAVHDCIGSNIFVHTRPREFSPSPVVMRVVPRDNEALNETWLSDRDRFSYEGLLSDARIAKPLVKVNGKWQEAEWADALNRVVDGLSNIREQLGPEQIGVLASANASVEELYLLQKLFRAIGVNNIDHRLRQLDFSDQDNAPPVPTLGMSIDDLNHLDAALLIGSNIRQEQPIAGLKLRKASLNGAKLMSINPIDYPVHFAQTVNYTVGLQEMPQALAGVAKALADISDVSLPKDAKALLTHIMTNDQQQQIARELLSAEKATLILGASALNHPHAAVIKALSRLIAQLAGVNYGKLTDSANGAGAWFAGAIPHRAAAARKIETAGLNARQMIENQLKAYVLLGVEPELDCALSGQAAKAMQNADLVIALSAFDSVTLRETADIILPIAAFSATSGTYINAESTSQTVKAVTLPYEEARPAWKILRVLGNLFNCDGFDYVSTEEILSDCINKVSKMDVAEHLWVCPDKITHAEGQCWRLGDWHRYRVDPLVRRAGALQKTITAEEKSLCLNANTAAKFKLLAGEMALATQGDDKISLPVAIDDRIPDHYVLISAGFAETAGFGQAFAPISIERSQ